MPDPNRPSVRTPLIDGRGDREFLVSLTHPINCSIIGGSSFQLRLLPEYGGNPLQRFHRITTG